MAKPKIMTETMSAPRRWRILHYLGSVIAVGGGIVFVVTVLRTQQAKAAERAAARQAQTQVQQACAQGLRLLEVVEAQLQQPDRTALAVDAAQNLIVFGRPWLDLCGATVEVDAFLDDDRVRLQRVVEEAKRQLTAEDDDPS